MELNGNHFRGLRVSREDMPDTRNVDRYLGMPEVWSSHWSTLWYDLIWFHALLMSVGIALFDLSESTANVGYRRYA